MRPSYRLLESAAFELKASANYYEGCSEGLGNDFLDAFEHAMDLILSFPEAWGTLDENFRRFLLRRFRNFGFSPQPQAGIVAEKPVSV